MIRITHLGLVCAISLFASCASPQSSIKTKTLAQGLILLSGVYQHSLKLDDCKGGHAMVKSRTKEGFVLALYDAKGCLRLLRNLNHKPGSPTPEVKFKLPDGSIHKLESEP